MAGVARAAREHLSGGAPPDLQRPERAVAAADVHALDPARDLHRSRDRAPPADDHPLLRLGMHGHTVGLHRAGNAKLLARRVGNHLQRPCSAPAVDSLPSLDALDLLVEEFCKLWLRRTDAQIRKPPRQQLRIDGVLPRQVGDRGPEGVGSDRWLNRSRLGPGREAFRRGRGQPLPLRGERGHHLLHEPQRQVGPPGSHEPRVFPDGKILSATVPGVAGREADRDRILSLRHRELHAEFLPVHEWRHRLHP